MNEQRWSFLRLFLFSLYSNRVRLIGSIVVTIIPLGYLITIYLNNPCSVQYLYHSDAESVAMPLFLAAFALVASQSLTEKTEKLSILGPHTRSKILLAIMSSTFLIGALAVLLAVAVLSITHYQLAILASQHCSGGSQVFPSLWEVVSVWLLRYSGFLGLYLYIMLLSFTLTIWGSRVLGESVNTLVALTISFFAGAGFQFELMLNATARYFTFTYYMIALGSILTGLDGGALGWPEIDFPGFLPLTLFGILFTILLFLSLALIGFKRLDVGVE